MMVKPWLCRFTRKLPLSASGLPAPRADCCRLPPDRPNSLIQASVSLTKGACVGVNSRSSGEYQSLAMRFTTVELGINPHRLRLRPTRVAAFRGFLL